MAASTDYHLKFLFPNHDGVFVVQTFSRNTLIAALKQSLLKDWPPGTCAWFGHVTVTHVSDLVPEQCA